MPSSSQSRTEMIARLREDGGGQRKQSHVSSSPKRSHRERAAEQRFNAEVERAMAKKKPSAKDARQRMIERNSTERD